MTYFYIIHIYWHHSFIIAVPPRLSILKQTPNDQYVDFHYD